MMKYINALELVNLALENSILHERDGKVITYMQGENFKDGWYLVDKEYAIQSLMRSEEGQTLIINKLLEKGIEFKPKYV